MKYLLLTLFFFNFFSAQNTTDFSQIVKNDSNYFIGKKAEKQEVKIKLDSVFADATNEDKYIIEGILEIDKDAFKISGKLSFNATQTK